MPRTVIHTEKAPKAIGPYSQAIAVTPQQWIYLSGQIPLDPATGNLVTGDITAQTQQVMRNIEAVLAAAGVGFEAVAKSTIFLTNLSDFAAVNEVYGKCFPHHPPARSTVQVAALPKGAQVEVEVVAVK